jgi:uncharacterized protein (DUF1330 family)
MWVPIGFVPDERSSPMAGYLVVNLTLKDPETYQQYKAAVPAIIAKHGGEYLVRGGKCEMIEGDWQPARLVIVRFPDLAAIRAFVSDPEYLRIKSLRTRSADSDIVAVEGI